MSSDWLDIGIEILLVFQNLGGWLAAPMLFFSFLGSESFFLLIAPAIYWCINAQIGLRLGLFLSISAGVNSIFKLVFHGPRPYWYDTRVRALAGEPTFGLPSGHSQHAVVVWGSLAASIGKRWLGLLAGIVIILIGLSRIYLGVHFPSDILAGWLIGILLLWALLILEPKVIAWLKRNPISTQISAALIASLMLILLAWLAREALGDWTVPQEWIDNAARAFPEGEPIHPLALSGIVSNAAIFFGLAAGGIWINSRGGFRAEGSAWHLLLRYALGLIGVVLFWSGLGMIFPDGESFFYLLLRYLRYALVGFWVAGLAPVIFIKLRLAESLQK